MFFGDSGDPRVQSLLPLLDEAIDVTRAACGVAMHTAQRTIVHDVRTSPVFGRRARRPLDALPPYPRGASRRLAEDADHPRPLIATPL